MPSPNLGPLQPDALRFAGPVVVLINGGTFSAAAEFATIAHGTNRAILVGQESGGWYCGNNSGGSFAVTLPNSQLRMVIPLVHYEMAVACNGNRRGVMPHEVVAPTIADVVDGVDRQMARALEIAVAGKR